MIDKFLKTLPSLVLSLGLYIVNDFKSDVQEKFNVFAKNLDIMSSTISSMNKSINTLNSSVATQIANDRAINLQIETHAKRFERLERKYDSRVERLEGLILSRRNL